MILYPPQVRLLRDEVAIMADHKGNVLFVDDDELTLEALRRLLSRQLSVHAVLDARSALKLMKEEQFAVVVTDLIMPGMSGFDLLKKLEKEHPETVCVVLSGRVVETPPAEMPKNVFRYLSKPCSMDALLAAIHAAFAEYILRFHRGPVAQLE